MAYLRGCSSVLYLDSSHILVYHIQAAINRGKLVYVRQRQPGIVDPIYEYSLGASMVCCLDWHAELDCNQ
jgi:hypothetical protein